MSAAAELANENSGTSSGFCTVIYFLRRQRSAESLLLPQMGNEFVPPASPGLTLLVARYVGTSFIFDEGRSV